jgi:hypothetical protein
VSAIACCKYGRVIEKRIIYDGLYILIACVSDNRELMHDDGTLVDL